MSLAIVTAFVARACAIQLTLPGGQKVGLRVTLALVSGSSTPTPRTANERALVALARVPRPVPILAVLGLLLVGMFVPTYGFIATGVVAAFLAWILMLSWPRLTGVEKLMRIAVIAFVAAIAIIQSQPR